MGQGRLKVKGQYLGIWLFKALWAGVTLGYQFNSIQMSLLRSIIQETVHVNNSMQ